VEDQIDPLFAGQSQPKMCYTEFRNDDTDQIHDETARQSRSAFGICLSVILS
jgi:hypothetical protein